MSQSHLFASRVFSNQLMEQRLSRSAFLNWQRVIQGKESLDSKNADAIADVFKTWAIEKGASHYSHWFQPLTQLFSEKQETFFKKNGIEAFEGKDLLSSETDASSFPSGGLRATYKARGYVIWDLSSFPFLWEGADGVLTLCIPSLFFSWGKEALDQKIPLLRSVEKIRERGLRLLRLCQLEAEDVFSTIGLEQEYFLIDRDLFLKRPDLVVTGRTIFGAKPPKGQELEDHYCGLIDGPVLAFMSDFEAEALALGIPVKTGHCEVAPNQYEVSPVFETASLAVDHNLILMELMRRCAVKHSFACLFHEKPFAWINGSGKHCNWSLSSSTGLNLLDPKGDSLLFLILITAVVHAVYEHAGLLRASIASLGNDHRLGGFEAPSTIISVDLGAPLEGIVDAIIQGSTAEKVAQRIVDLGLIHIPLQKVDVSDRNRTSFFAFTGNKFEFRAVGASAQCAFVVTVVNAIVADSLQLILDEIGDCREMVYALPVLQKHLKQARDVIFGGNAYCDEWEREAKARGLPNIRCSIDAFKQMLEKKSERCFQGILSEKELQGRYEIFVEMYAKTMEIDIRLMIELFRTQILPAVLQTEKNRADALTALLELSIKTGNQQLESLQNFSDLVNLAIDAIDALEKLQEQIEDLGWEAKGKVLSEIGAPKMALARSLIDKLEMQVEDFLWPLPKYRELLCR